MLSGTNNPIELCGALCELVQRRVHSTSFKQAVLRLRTNNTSFWNNYLVSDFATAALHLLGWESYNGDRREVLQLIASGLTF